MLGSRTMIVPVLSGKELVQILSIKLFGDVLTRSVPVHSSRERKLCRVISFFLGTALLT